MAVEQFKNDDPDNETDELVAGARDEEAKDDSEEFDDDEDENEDEDENDGESKDA